MVVYILGRLITTLFLMQLYFSLNADTNRLLKDNAACPARIGAIM